MINQRKEEASWLQRKRKNRVTHFYDQEDILFEFDENEQIKARYTHGPGIDEPISVDRDTDGNGTLDTTYYYHFDGLGSVIALTDISGNVVQTYVYDAFGKIVQQTGSIGNPYTYTGREWDAEAGLYYYRARYYDPTLGRFINGDPIGFAGGDVNFYVYVQNNPVNWIDPWGQEIVIIGRGFYDTYLEPALKPTSDIFDVYQGAEQAAKGCPTEPWLDKKLDEIARSDMNSDVNSQVPATTTESNPTVIPPNTGHYPYFPVSKGDVD